MKGRKSERIILHKMIQYCNKITQILENHHFNRDEFESDIEFQFASGMCILQLGELVARFDDDFTGRYPDIPWRQIKGLRNIYAHDYDIIDNNIIWETITEEIPKLQEKLQVIFNVVSKNETSDE